MSFKLGRIFRVFILIRVIKNVYNETHNLKKGARNLVSENKQRYRGDGFDLDLTYVTDRVIGMSFPSSGLMSLYRNNICEVGQFLDLQHGMGNYKVYNLCSEKHYDEKYFHGSVARYCIDDHNVPSLEQMLEFVKDARNFLSLGTDNVIAVHCKGGKGRTGTMICSWLIFSKEFQTSQEALDYFAEQRTDKTLSDKFQGVETPSQSRYVEYFTQIVQKMDSKIPPKVQLNINTIEIKELKSIGIGNGSDLVCTIWIDRKTVFILDFSSDLNCKTQYDSIKDVLTIKPTNCPTLEGNIRMKFDCKTVTVPKAYENCAFYFWFNTSFINNSKDGEYELTLKREDLDNPHKKKVWNIYRERFSVTLKLAKL